MRNRVITRIVLSALQSVAIRGDPWQSVEMTDKEMEAVPQKGSSSADGATGMDWLTPKGL